MTEVNCKPTEPVDDIAARKIKQLQEINCMMAHNLRGPLSNIKMLASLLLDDDDLVKNEDTMESLQMILNSSGALMDTVCSLLEVAQLPLEEELQWQKCDVAAITGKVVNELQSLIKDKHASIGLSLATCFIHYPEVYLESILYNLISNSLKYSKPGIPLHITVSTITAGAKVMLSVQDNGIGINLDSDKDIFEALPQLGNFESRGVGLLMTKQSVESLGGSLQVQGKVNEGARFTITF